MSSTSCSTRSLRTAQRLAVLGLGVFALAGPVRAQVDTTAAAPPLIFVESAETTPRSVSPGGALRRSLLVPGWGQLYNRDWIKVPVALGGVGAAGAFVYVLNEQTVRYRRAAIYDDCLNGVVEGDACTDFESYRDEWLEAGEPTAAQSRAFRDNRRRNRDLMVLLGVLAYGLQALDAYVSAELADFDVGEDLSLRLVPTPNGPAAALRWTF